MPRQALISSKCISACRKSPTRKINTNTPERGRHIRRQVCFLRDGLSRGLHKYLNRLKMGAIGHLHKYSSQVHICVALRMQSLSLKAPAISAFRDRCVTILTRSAQIFFSGSDLCSLKGAEFGPGSPSDFCVARFLRPRNVSTASIWILGLRVLSCEIAVWANGRHEPGNV